jgi:hypothetical protein
MKKSLAGLTVQEVSYVPNKYAHVSKALDIRDIMGLQDMQAGSTINTCKTCRQAATVHLQYNTNTVDYLPDIATVQGGPKAWRHAAGRVQRGRTIRHDISHAAEDIICYS